MNISGLIYLAVGFGPYATGKLVLYDNVTEDIVCGSTLVWGDEAIVFVMVRSLFDDPYARCVGSAEWDVVFCHG